MTQKILRVQGDRGKAGISSSRILPGLSLPNFGLLFVTLSCPTHLNQQEQFPKTLPLSHYRQDEEHPEVNSKHKNDLKNDLSQYSLSEVQCSVHHHGSKLNEDHHQKRSGHLVLGQRRGDVCGC